MINTILLLIVISGLIIILFLMFVVLERKNKAILAKKEEEIKEQFINELKKDYQIVAARAVLNGEEQERTRISRELHDSLGGLLTAMKIALSGIKEECPTGEMKERLQPVLGQLNDSIHELRRISHNLMPPAIVQFGLKEALNDYCIQMSKNNRTSVNFIFYGRLFRFNSSMEIALYRIAQEAINNALKYSKATEIKVQLIQEEEWVNLTIQDNGTGFTAENHTYSETSGLKNMRARAESLDGRLDISSTIGTGTEVIVDFILTPNHESGDLTR